ncbi:MAG: cytochrome c [Bryobacterales bacterium]
MVASRMNLMDLLALVLVVSSQSACVSGRHSPTGFRLPENGDPARGKAAFIELRCYGCHRVAGDQDLPEPDQAAATVTLGGDVSEIRTDGYLVTSIIHPSHRARSPQTVEGESPMPDYTRMSVRQLIDLVAYLQSRYRVVPPPPVFP